MELFKAIVGLLGFGVIVFGITYGVQIIKSRLNKKGKSGGSCCS